MHTNVLKKHITAAKKSQIQLSRRWQQQKNNNSSSSNNNNKSQNKKKIEMRSNKSSPPVCPTSTSLPSRWPAPWWLWSQCTPWNGERIRWRRMWPRRWRLGIRRGGTRCPPTWSGTARSRRSAACRGRCSPSRYRGGSGWPGKKKGLDWYDAFPLQLRLLALLL